MPNKHRRTLTKRSGMALMGLQKSQRLPPQQGSQGVSLQHARVALGLLGHATACKVAAALTKVMKHGTEVALPPQLPAPPVIECTFATARMIEGAEATSVFTVARERRAS